MDRKFLDLVETERLRLEQAASEEQRRISLRHAAVQADASLNSNVQDVVDLAVGRGLKFSFLIGHQEWHRRGLSQVGNRATFIPEEGAWKLTGATTTNSAEIEKGLSGSYQTEYGLLLTENAAIYRFSGPPSARNLNRENLGKVNSEDALAALASFVVRLDLL